MVVVLVILPPCCRCGVSVAVVADGVVVVPQLPWLLLWWCWWCHCGGVGVATVAAMVLPPPPLQVTLGPYLLGLISSHMN
jgi:hypothetical protein